MQGRKSLWHHSNPTGLCSLWLAGWTLSRDYSPNCSCNQRWALDSLTIVVYLHLKPIDTHSIVQQPCSLRLILSPVGGFSLLAPISHRHIWMGNSVPCSKIPLVKGCNQLIPVLGGVPGPPYEDPL